MSKHKKQAYGGRLRNRLSVAKKLVSSNGYSFSTCYMELCRQQRIRPLPLICVALPSKLEFTADRVKMDEWGPILTSLSLDRVLRTIKIHSRCQNRKPLEDITSENKARKLEKTPLVLTRYILERMSQSLAQCIRNSLNLICLELEGVPLTTDCVSILCVGIAGSQSLQHLSLCKSYIGDSGCEMICQTITNARTIKSLNLSQCNLSARCGTALATALSRQKLSLYHDTWKQSLRYRQPNFDAMPGLRRLTLNGNPHLGNSATNKIIDAVRDSLWMKALDLQNCGLTNDIAAEILDLVHRNGTLVVVDVRLNAHLDGRVVDEIMRQLDRNHEDADKAAYKWNGVPRKKVKSAVSVRRTRSARVDGQTNIAKATSAIADSTTAQLCNGTDHLSIERMPPISSPIVTAKASNKAQKPLSSDDECATLDKSKPSLHIDLQTQMVQKSDMETSTIQSPRESTKATTIDETVVSTPIHDPNHHELLEKIDSLDMMLHEERLRRRLAEEKLSSMKKSVLELERALRQKEQEMQGYVLVSQDSLDEICESFDQLLELLNDLSTSEQYREQPYDVNDIQSRMSMLIRRTKSDGMKKRQQNNLRTPRMFVKSESNFGGSPINLPIRIDRDMSDSVDILTPKVIKKTSGRRISNTVERSRAIFTQLISGDSTINRDFEY